MDNDAPHEELTKKSEAFPLCVFVALLRSHPLFLFLYI